VFESVESRLVRLDSDADAALPSQEVM
jgi:hypothetical protein